MSYFARFESSLLCFIAVCRSLYYKIYQYPAVIRYKNSSFVSFFPWSASRVECICAEDIPIVSRSHGLSSDETRPGKLQKQKPIRRWRCFGKATGSVCIYSLQFIMLSFFSCQLAFLGILSKISTVFKFGSGVSTFSNCLTSFCFNGQLSWPIRDV